MTRAGIKQDSKVSCRTFIIKNVSHKGDTQDNKAPSLAVHTFQTCKHHPLCLIQLAVLICIAN